MKLILLGAPASGKGTLSRDLQKKYDIPAISTGDIIRENIQAKTKLGKICNEYISKGNLVPDELIIELVKDRLKQADVSNGYILDGFPRTINQAVALNEIENITKVIYLDASFDVILERSLSRRICPNCKKIYNTSKYALEHCEDCNEKLILRDDDNEMTTKRRFDVFEAQTKPLIKFYDDLELLIKVDANLDSNTVFECVVDILERK